MCWPWVVDQPQLRTTLCWRPCSPIVVRPTYPPSPMSRTKPHLSYVAICSTWAIIDPLLQFLSWSGLSILPMGTFLVLVAHEAKSWSFTYETMFFGDSGVWSLDTMGMRGTWSVSLHHICRKHRISEVDPALGCSLQSLGQNEAPMLCWTAYRMYSAIDQRVQWESDFNLTWTHLAMVLLSSGSDHFGSFLQPTTLIPPKWNITLIMITWWILQSVSAHLHSHLSHYGPSLFLSN